MADEKKMTQVKALETAVEVLQEFGAVDEHVEAREVLEAMIAKKKAPRKPRVNKEAVEFRAVLVEVLREAEGPLTNAELTVVMAERTENPELKPQKISNNIRVLEKEGTVVRIRGEKASDKDRFALA